MNFRTLEMKILRWNKSSIKLGYPPSRLKVSSPLATFVFRNAKYFFVGSVAV
jgi:hypothetical protein